MKPIQALTLYTAIAIAIGFAAGWLCADESPKKEPQITFFPTRLRILCKQGELYFIPENVKTATVLEQSDYQISGVTNLLFVRPR